MTVSGFARQQGMLAADSVCKVNFVRAESDTLLFNIDLEGRSMNAELPLGAYGFYATALGRSSAGVEQPCSPLTAPHQAPGRPPRRARTVAAPCTSFPRQAHQPCRPASPRTRAHRRRATRFRIAGYRAHQVELHAEVPRATVHPFQTRTLAMRIRSRLPHQFATPTATEYPA